MTAPDKIYAWLSMTKPQGVSFAGGRVGDEIEYTRTAIDARFVTVAQLTDWLDVIARLSPGFVWGSATYLDVLPKQDAVQREIRAIIGGQANE
jgi:hypothetical protein